MKLQFAQNKLNAAPCFRQTVPRSRLVTRAAAATTDDLGFKMMRRGVKEAADESILTPRFYTTDFEKMEEMFSCVLSAELHPRKEIVFFLGIVAREVHKALPTKRMRC